MALITFPLAPIGALLQYQATVNSTSWTTLALLKDDCDFETWETAQIELKTLASGSVGRTPGRIDYKGFSGSCFLVNADGGNAFLLSSFTSRSMITWRFILNDGTTPNVPGPGTGSTYEFLAFVAEFHPGPFSGEDVPVIEFSLAINGSVVVTPGS